MHAQHDAGCSAEVRADMLKRMQAASDAFYKAAVGIHCHPFIEFTGLLNQYIQLCHRAQSKEIDFTQCNRHTGSQLPMAGHDIDYLREKLECIFSGQIEISEPVTKGREGGRASAVAGGKMAA